MGDKLTDQTEILFRQIHPTFIENGEPSSQPFKPTEKDRNLLSVDRSSMVSAERSHVGYTAAGMSSSAVYGLTVGEFGTEKIVCNSDPVDDGDLKNAAHSVADYSAHTASQQKNVAKRLKRKAIERGCLHPASNEALSNTQTGT